MKKLKFLAIILGLIIAGPVFCYYQNQKADYITYFNARYQFEVKYPRDLLKPNPPPADNDGRSFDSPDKKTKMIVAGGYNAMEWSWKENFEKTLEEFKDAKITYKIFKKDLFVISGYQGDKIFYCKELRVIEDGMEVFLEFDIEYPQKDKGMWNDIVTACVNSFRMSDTNIPTDTNLFGLGTNADQFK